MSQIRFDSVTKVEQSRIVLPIFYLSLLYNNNQNQLVGRITAKRARGLPVSGLWCRITMRKLVQELGDEIEAKRFKASAQWFNSFGKRWGFTLEEKTNVKKISVEARLPYVRKYHQYIFYIGRSVRNLRRYYFYSAILLGKTFTLVVFIVR